MKSGFFKNKKVLITGASSGLGKELCLQLVNEGASVIGLARNEDKLNRLRGHGIDTHVCDISNKDQVTCVLSSVLKTWENIDIVILNAGIKFSEGNDFSLEKILKTFQTNILGNLYCLDAILPCMEKQQKGHLVFISSLGGYHGMVNSNGYNASKAALSIFADSLRMDLKAQKKTIHITVVKPGLIHTEMTQNVTAPPGLSVSREKAARVILKGIMKRKKEVVFPKLMFLSTLAISLFPKRFQASLLMKMKS